VKGEGRKVGGIEGDGGWASEWDVEEGGMRNGGRRVRKGGEGGVWAGGGADKRKHVRRRLREG